MRDASPTNTSSLAVSSNFLMPTMFTAPCRALGGVVSSSLSSIPPVHCPHLETRTKSSAPGRSRRPGAAGGACKGVRAGGGAVRGAGRALAPPAGRGLLRGVWVCPAPGGRPLVSSHSCASRGRYPGTGWPTWSPVTGARSSLEHRGLPGRWGALGGSTNTWTGKGLCQRAELRERMFIIL